MDEVRVNLPTKEIELKMAVLMDNGMQIKEKLDRINEQDVDNPKDFMKLFNEGFGLLSELKGICDDLSVLSDLHTLSELFGGDDD